MKHRLLYTHGLLVLALASCGEKPAGKPKHHMPPDTVKAMTASPSEVIASSQRTILPAVIDSAAWIRLNGYIVADPGRNHTLSVRAGGRIEKLYARYSYQYIEKGAPLLELYSPALNTASEEYLLLLKSNSDKELINKSREKLLLMGLTDMQVKNIERTGTVSRTVILYSPHSGYLLPPEGASTRAVSNPESRGKEGMQGMNDQSGQAATYASGTVKEGSYVNAGQALFTINDLRVVWAIVSITETNAEKGDSVILHIGNKDPLRETIDFTEPVYLQDQKSGRARIYLDNRHGEYKVNDLFTAELKGQAGTYLAVPDKSVLTLGERKVVWVKTGRMGKNNVFEARTVSAGESRNGYIPVFSGLSEKEEIAETAGFMIDSEGLIEQ
jgi:membrane fusion protein, copper/silver efflux system